MPTPAEFFCDTILPSAQKDYEAQHARTTQLVWRKHGDQHSLMLKEPRQLFSTNRDPPIHASQPRWPFEMPCINVRPQHISYLPPAREAFYNRAVDDFPHRPSKPYNKPKLVYYTPLFTEPNVRPVSRYHVCIAICVSRMPIVELLVCMIL